MPDESGAVRAQLVVTRTSEEMCVWTWSIGLCAVSLSYPVPADGVDDPGVHEAMEALVYNLPALVVSGINEVDVELFKRDLEENL